MPVTVPFYFFACQLHLLLCFWWLCTRFWKPGTCLWHVCSCDVVHRRGLQWGAKHKHKPQSVKTCLTPGLHMHFTTFSRATSFQIRPISSEQLCKIFFSDHWSRALSSWITQNAGQNHWGDALQRNWQFFTTLHLRYSSYSERHFINCLPIKDFWIYANGCIFVGCGV